jgi:hypothetical protein
LVRKDNEKREGKNDAEIDEVKTDAPDLLHQASAKNQFSNFAFVLCGQQ